MWHVAVKDDLYRAVVVVQLLRRDEVGVVAMHMAVDADDLLDMGGNRSQNVRYHDEQIVAVIEEAVGFRNKLVVRANHPADKKNKSLVRRHYDQMTHLINICRCRRAI